MKHLRILLIALVTFGSVNLMQAQSKIAHISTQELIESMPDYQAAMSTLKKLKNSYASKIDDMYKEAKEKAQRYQDQQDTISDAENQNRVKDMQDTQARILQFQKNAQEQLSQKQEELLKPILKRAKDAIQAVADKDGYDYVLDSTAGSAVIVANGPDILNEVQKQLGITTP